MNFRDPLLLLLAFVVPLVVWSYFRRQAGGTVRFSSLGTLKRVRSPWSVRGRHVLIALRTAVILLLVAALARPQSGKEETRITTEGIDIVLAVDISGSMRAEDLDFARHVSRVQAAKNAAKDFIKGRETDRIGLVVFASLAYTQCPLTLDYGVLLQFLDKIDIGQIPDGTAIGSAIAASVARLKDTKAKSKVVVLLTDGRNNAGKIAPATAAQMAKAFNIKIYTIGVGTREPFAPFPSQDFFGNRVYVRQPVDIDEKMLQEVAATTGGRYFRATDTDSLRKIYAEIDQLEKTEAEVKTYTEYNELFPKLIIPALALLLLEVLAANTRFRKIP
ncbi:MAG: VWA domain-containing protein [Planctomycetes bacterium]|nr:VWA domain-containing protein [Planctomycetota bacterium]